jgi:hypothetical protein
MVEITTQGDMTMKTYLDPDHPDAFIDFPAPPAPPEYMGATVECPLCKGHGGWNLALNEYKLHGKEDTPENRHLFSHFRASCSQCQGYGHVRPEDSDHVHEWKWIQNIGNCLNLHECTKCGKKWQIDSSD